MSGDGTELAAMPALEVTGRPGRLRARFESAEVDGLLVTNLANVRYLTGFTGSAAVLLVDADAMTLTTDGRYRTQAAEQLAAAGLADAVELVVGSGPAQRDALVDRARRPGGGRIGLEG